MTMANPGWGSGDLDTADVYAGGAGEELLDRLLTERGVRDGVVLATKYGFTAGGGAVSGGSGRANMARAVEGSLRRLRTDRIDLSCASEQSLPDDVRRRLDAASAPQLGNPHALFTEQMVDALTGGGKRVRLTH